MRAYYQVAIVKETLGSAIRYREPYLVGTPVIKIMDTTTAGENKIIVMDCSDQEHTLNLNRPGVMELNPRDAHKLAAQYQPKHERLEMRGLTSKRENIKFPSFDLDGFIKGHDKRQRSASSAGTVTAANTNSETDTTAGGAAMSGARKTTAGAKNTKPK